MNVFLVALDDDNASPDDMHVQILEHFKDAAYRLSKLTWVIADEDSDPNTICLKLGLSMRAGEQPPASGIVVLVAESGGYADKALWSLMRKWSMS